MTRLCCVFGGMSSKRSIFCCDSRKERKGVHLLRARTLCRNASDIRCTATLYVFEILLEPLHHHQVVCSTVSWEKARATGYTRGNILPNLEV